LNFASPEELAVNTGANVLSEAFVFTVAAGLLTYEIQRKSKEDEAKTKEKASKEEAKEHALHDRFMSIESKLAKLQEQQQHMYTQYNEMMSSRMQRNVDSMSSNTVTRSKSVPNETSISTSNKDMNKHTWWR